MWKCSRRSPARPAEGKELDSDRAVSDRDGRIRIEVDRERVAGRRTGVTIWAYKAGRALVRGPTVAFAGPTSPLMTKVVIEEPVKRTIRVVGPDEKPIKGLRLFPRSLVARNSNFPRHIPEPLRVRLTVSTDAKGEATLPYMPAGLEPVTVEVSGAGIAPQTLTLIDFATKPMLRIGRAGRLVGGGAENRGSRSGASRSPFGSKCLADYRLRCLICVLLK